MTDAVCWKTISLGAANSHLCIIFLPFKNSPLLTQLWGKGSCGWQGKVI